MMDKKTLLLITPEAATSQLDLDALCAAMASAFAANGFNTVARRVLRGNYGAAVLGPYRTKRALPSRLAALTR